MAPEGKRAMRTNDHRTPVLAVRPDGNKLFIAWYDRQNDPNNSLVKGVARYQADIRLARLPWPLE